MAYINKNTYDIVEDDSINPELYFECDEEIAEVIRALNIKGYKTKACCSGHLYDEIFSFIWRNGSTADIDIKMNIPGVFEVVGQDDGTKKCLARIPNEFGPYIMFTDGIKLPSVPEGWEKDKQDIERQDIDAAGELRMHETIRLNYEDVVNLDDMRHNPYRFFRVRADIMEKLYRWVVDLPKN